MSPKFEPDNVTTTHISFFLINIFHLRFIFSQTRNTERRESSSMIMKTIDAANPLVNSLIPIWTHKMQL